MSDRVVPQLPERLSPSGANLFRSCPRRFWHEKVMQEPTFGSVATVTGNLVHEVLEQLWHLPVGERTYVKAADLAHRTWARMRHAESVRVDLMNDPTFRSESPLVANALNLLRRYFTLEDVTVGGTVTLPSHGTTTGTELYVNATVAQAPLHGYIDRVEDLPGGTHARVVDYKTGKRPKRPQYLDNYWFQLLTYALLLRQQHSVHVTHLRLVYLQGAIYERDITHEDLDAHQEEIAGTWHAIVEAFREDHWQAKPTILCGWCPFRDDCRAYQRSYFARLHHSA